MTPQKSAKIIWDAVQNGVYYPEELKGSLSREEGYRTQLELLDRHITAGEEQAGWKIGATAAVVREQLKTEEPVFGYLLASRGFTSGLSFSFADMITPLLESELCFTLGRPLKGPGVTRAQVSDAVSSVAPAFEILEGRGDIAADLPLGVADNVLQWAWVTGAEMRPYPRDLDLGDVRAEIICNTKVKADVLGREVIDNQLDSIAWLANQLSQYGAGLKVGHRILSGSFNAPLPISRGERWETRFSGLGSVSVRFD